MGENSEAREEVARKAVQICENQSAQNIHARIHKQKYNISTM